MIWHQIKPLMDFGLDWMKQIKEVQNFFRVRMGETWEFLIVQKTKLQCPYLYTIFIYNY